MYCTNCGRKIVKNFCIHCGLMTNGIYVDSNKPQEETEIEIYFGNDYDKIARNKNWFISGLLGPVYIMARGNFIAGFFLMLIDLLITCAIMIINHAFLFLSIVTLFNVIYLMINRIIWATIGNMLYIKLTNKKIKNMKEGINYRIDDEISKQYKRDTRLLTSKSTFLFIINLIIFRIVTLYIYSIFGFVNII